jgi:hypothetical protein
MVEVSLGRALHRRDGPGSLAFAHQHVAALLALGESHIAVEAEGLCAGVLALDRAFHLWIITDGFESLHHHGPEDVAAIAAPQLNQPSAMK